MGLPPTRPSTCPTTCSTSTGRPGERAPTARLGEAPRRLRRRRPRGLDAMSGQRARRLGGQAPDVSGRREGRHPQGQRQVLQAAGRRRARPARRRRRPHRQHRHRAQGPRRRSPTSRRPPDLLRRPRARHGPRSMNGMALHGGVLPVGGTFFVFSDYMRPRSGWPRSARPRSSTRFTHDSVGVGEDGPTHQPVEHLAALRAIPDLRVIRPADANETAAGVAAGHRAATAGALVLSRQDLPVLEGTAAGQGLARAPTSWRPGATATPTLVLIGTGSEVPVASTPPTCSPPGGSAPGSCRCRAGSCSSSSTTTTRTRCCPDVPALAVEAGVPFGWERWADDVGIDRFGASAPGAVVLDELGFNPPNVVGGPTWPTWTGPCRLTWDEEDHDGTPARPLRRSYGQSPWLDNLSGAGSPRRAGAGSSGRPRPHVEPDDLPEGHRRSARLRRAVRRPHRRRRLRSRRPTGSSSATTSRRAADLRPVYDDSDGARRLRVGRGRPRAWPTTPTAPRPPPAACTRRSTSRTSS